MLQKKMIRRTSLIIIIGMLISMIVPILAFANQATTIWYNKGTNHLSGYVYSRDYSKVNVKVTTPSTVTNISYGISGGRLGLSGYDDQNNYYSSYFFDVISAELPTSISVSDGYRNYNLNSNSIGSEVAYYDSNPVRLDAYRMPGQEFVSTVTANSYLAPNAPIVNFTAKTAYADAIQVDFPKSVSASTYIDFSKVEVSDFVLTDMTTSQNSVIQSVYGNANWDSTQNTYVPSLNTLILKTDTLLLQDHTYSLKLSATSSGEEIKSAGIGKEGGSVAIGEPIIYPNIKSPYNVGYFWNYNVFFFDQDSTVSGQKSGGSSGQTSGNGSSGGSSTSTSSPNEEFEISEKDNEITLRVSSTVGKTEEKTISRAEITSGTLKKAMDVVKSSHVDRPIITIDTQDTEDHAQAVFSAESLNAISKETSNTVIQVQFKDASYNLPVSVLDYPSLAAQLGTEQEKVKITVSKEKLDKNIIQNTNLPITVLNNPIDFKVIAEADGKQVEIHNFNQLVKRTIVVPSILEPTSSTVLLYDSGKLQFVPATFEVKDGKTVITIQRNGNSIYTVVKINQSFEDIETSWAKSDITLLGSKGVLNGVGETTFAPSALVTRAQFASMLVRSLGITSTDYKVGEFTDVHQEDWFARDVQAAANAKLVTGYNDGSFQPNKNITREEMAVMYQRAIEFTGKKASIDQTQNLGNYSDAESIAVWALPAVTMMKETGILTGTTDNNYSPKQYADRAQTAATLKRFLQYSGLIN